MKAQGKKYTATAANGKLEIRENGTVVYTMISDSSAISPELENEIIKAIVNKINFN